MTNLIFVASKAAAFHGTWVEVALVVKLKAGQPGVQLIENRRQAAPQRQQLGARAVKPNTHGTLQGHAASVAEQRADRTNEKRIKFCEFDIFLHHSPNLFFSDAS